MQRVSARRAAAAAPDPGDRPVAAGPHECNLCHSFVAAGVFAVPGSEVLFVAPEMLAHYVDHHSYLPPAEFLNAVESCPVPGTAEYCAAISSYRDSAGGAG